IATVPPPESYPLELESEYLDSLRLGDYGRAVETLNQIVPKIIQISNADSGKFRELILDFAATISRNLVEAGTALLPPELARNELGSRIAAIDNMDDIQELLSTYTKTVADFFCAVNKPGCRKIIATIMTYVKNNYFQDITLRRIAEDF